MAIEDEVTALRKAVAAMYEMQNEHTTQLMALMTLVGALLRHFKNDQAFGSLLADVSAHIDATMNGSAMPDWRITAYLNAMRDLIPRDLHPKVSGL